MLMSLVATAGVSVSLPKLLFLAASTLLLLLLGANLLLLGIAFRRIIRFAIGSIEEVEKHKKAIRRGIHIQRRIHDAGRGFSCLRATLAHKWAALEVIADNWLL